MFNYYHLSLLLTSLNCVADPALYCFVSESARHGLYAAVFRPVARILCCCCRHSNSTPSNPATDSHEVATDEYNSHPTLMLLTHSCSAGDNKTDTIRKKNISITQANNKTMVPLTVQHNRHHVWTEMVMVMMTEMPLCDGKAGPKGTEDSGDWLDHLFWEKWNDQGCLYVTSRDRRPLREPFLSLLCVLCFHSEMDL